MIRRVKFTPEAFEKYLDGLNDKFETSILWNTLKEKSEYGASKSEKYYQIYAAHKAASMANKLHLNIDRALFYTKCLGSAFPAFGKAGKKCVIEYASSNHLSYIEKEIMASVIEESFAQGGRFIVEGLREILLELFDASSDSSIQEIELAKLFHVEMEILKKFDSSNEAYLENEKRLDEIIENNIDTLGITGTRKLLLNEVDREVISLSEEEKKDYFKKIDQYREYSGDECLINFIIYATNIRKE